MLITPAFAQGAGAAASGSEIVGKVRAVAPTVDPQTRLALTGDWNIAPQDEDVWDIELFQREGYTHVSPAERAAFHAFEDAGLVDVVRPRHPGPGRRGSAAARGPPGGPVPPTPRPRKTSR